MGCFYAFSPRKLRFSFAELAVSEQKSVWKSGYQQTLGRHGNATPKTKGN